MSISGMFAIPLTLIPLTMWPWQTSGFSVLIALRSSLVAAPPRYALALKKFEPRYLGSYETRMACLAAARAAAGDSHGYFSPDPRCKTPVPNKRARP